MRKLRRAILAICAVAILFTGTVYTQREADRLRAEVQGDLLYVPNEKLLRHFTAGLDSVIADFMWLHCIQYTAQQLHGDRSFRWLEQMLDTITTLDPYFTGAYRYGGIFLASLKADDDASVELLRRGIAHNPWAWQIPYELGMVYLLNRQDEPGSEKIASYYLGMAAAAGAPEVVRNLAADLQGKYNLVDIERNMWAGLLESDDRFLREMAEGKLIELNLKEWAAQLTEVVAQYRARTGALPGSLQELVAQGIIPPLPEDPFGGTFEIDQNGTVYSTSLQNSEAQHLRSLLQNGIQDYHERFGHYPETLQDLVQQHVMTEIPPNPIPGENWAYNPATGAVE
jgi:hypothetical protein